MTLSELNALSAADAREQLLRCCGSSRWVSMLIDSRPFRDRNELFAAAGNIWQQLLPEDWKEAFSYHPRIGDLESLRTKFAATQEWASTEQAGVQRTTDETLLGLAEGNKEYEKNFGYIFIICATGKSAGEILTKLRQRLHNPPEEEIRVAAYEQSLITRIRLEKLLA